MSVRTPSGFWWAPTFGMDGGRDGGALFHRTDATGARVATVGMVYRPTSEVGWAAVRYNPPGIEHDRAMFDTKENAQTWLIAVVRMEN